MHSSQTGSPNGLQPQSSVANRYGGPKPVLTRRAKVVAIAVILALAVIGTAVFSFFVAQPAVRSKDVGFTIIDAHHATVDFEVVKAPNKTAQCAIQVLSESYAIVGWKVVTVEADPSASASGQMRTTAHRAELRTESLGTSGGVNACWTVD